MRNQVIPRRTLLQTATLAASSVAFTSCNSMAAPKDPIPKSLWTRAEGADWNTILGPTGDGKSTEKLPRLDFTERPPKVVWQRPAGVGYSGPTVALGRLVHFEQRGAKASAFCLHAETGEELWNFEYASSYRDMYGYDDGPRCSPVIDGDRVYLMGAEGMLHCLQLETGKEVWKVDTTTKFGVVQNFFGVGSTPCIEGDLLIAMVGGSPPELRNGRLSGLKGNGTGIVAFDKRTGAVRYQISDELASYTSIKVHTIGERRLGLAFMRSGLVAFEPSKGSLDFHFPWRAKILESVNASNPVVVDDQVFISETYGPGSAILKVSPKKYDIAWQDDPKKRDKVLKLHWNTAIHHEGYLYGSSGRHSEEAELRCVSWADQSVKWSESGLSRSSLTYCDGHFLMATEYGDVLLIAADPKRYHVVGELTPYSSVGRGKLLQYPCWGAPVLSHGYVYLRGKGLLLCLDLA